MEETNSILRAILQAVTNLQTEVRILGEKIETAGRNNGKAQMPTRLQLAEDAKTLLCPECGGPMHVRERKHEKGAFFFGCTSYPMCNGLRNLDGTARQRFVKPAAKTAGKSSLKGPAKERKEFKKKITNRNIIKSAINHGLVKLDESGKIIPADPEKLEILRKNTYSPLRLEKNGEEWELFEIR